MLRSELFLYKQIVKLLSLKNEFSKSDAVLAANYALEFKRKNPKSCPMLVINEARTYAKRNQGNLSVSNAIRMKFVTH